jgi:DUF3072 family protein
MCQQISDPTWPTACDPAHNVEAHPKAERAIDKRPTSSYVASVVVISTTAGAEEQAASVGVPRRFWPPWSMSRIAISIVSARFESTTGPTVGSRCLAMPPAQRSYLETLARDAAEVFDEELTNAEASERIDELLQRVMRGKRRVGSHTRCRNWLARARWSSLSRTRQPERTNCPQNPQRRPMT